ncbi:MAG TPA: energy transducer TonB [Pyrinomonadaceae bacterium]|nr:energy transducer TonB [Pyrinomonadaceae bacterium]
MFNNLIESQSHVREFKRRGRFLLATTAAYGLLFFVAGIASIYAYDARLDAQNGDLALLSWVPPVMIQVDPQPHRTPPTANNIKTGSQTTRPILYESVNNPHTPPAVVSTAPQVIPPAPPNAIIGRNIVNAAGPQLDNSTECPTCTGSGRGPVIVHVETTPPPAPTPVKPKTETLSSRLLISKAVSLPQPPYPAMARQIRIQGAVNVQILVDEQGRVISAQVVSGHPLLSASSKDAAMRARFTPTVLNGQAVKVQGVITYNFVLQ